MGVRNYRELVVWQKAMNFVTEIYRVSEQFPKEERFGLTSQIRRAVVSIPTNISEGEGRESRKEFAQFLAIAHGSLRETETLFEIALRLKFIPAGERLAFEEQASEIGRMLNGLMRTVRESL